MEKTPSNVNLFAKATSLDKYIWQALFWSVHYSEKALVSYV